METFAPGLAPPPLLRLLAHDLRWQLVTALARSDYRVHELVDLLKQPMNLISYHLQQLRRGHLVTERRSSADGRDVYYHLDLEHMRVLYLASGAAIHPGLTTSPDAVPTAQPAAAAPPARVIFLCTHNSARSQMAEGILRELGGDRVMVVSAGTQPGSVHPDAVRALAEMGIDISQYQAKHLDQFRDQTFDYTITVCDRVREACPVFPGDPTPIHWSFPDPVLLEDPTERERQFQAIAMQLVTRIRYLLILIDRNQKGL